MPAIMVTRCRYFQLGPLRIADTQILSICPKGAQQFGYENPRALAGRYMSDLQSKAWRDAGHRRYLARKLGQPVTKDYVVMIQRPDGEEVGQVREFGGWLCGPQPGEDMYLTYLEQTRHVDHPPAFRALSPAEAKVARHYNGDCTVAELRRMASDPQHLPLALRGTFPHIIRECVELSSGLFAGKYASPLDLALSDDVAVCWHERPQRTKTLVRPRFVCDRCGWVWFGRVKRQGECSGCGKHFRRWPA